MILEFLHSSPVILEFLEVRRVRQRSPVVGRRRGPGPAVAAALHPDGAALDARAPPAVVAGRVAGRVGPDHVTRMLLYEKRTEKNAPKQTEIISIWLKLSMVFIQPSITFAFAFAFSKTF